MNDKLDLEMALKNRYEYLVRLESNLKVCFVNFCLLSEKIVKKFASISEDNLTSLDSLLINMKEDIEKLSKFIDNIYVGSIKEGDK